MAAEASVVIRRSVSSPMTTQRLRSLLGRIAIHGILLLTAVLFLAPLFVMVATSFKEMDEIRGGSMIALPQTWTAQPWREAWDAACIGVSCSGLRPYFANSIMMAGPAVVISCLLGALNGYVLTKWKFHGSELLFGLMLFGCFIPYQVVLIPMAKLLGIIGISGSIQGLILVHTVYGLAFTTLFFRNYFVGFPSELIRAARIDGAGFFGIFFRIVLPNSLPILAVAVIWQFTNIWNDFLFGASFAGAGAQPVMVALNNLVNTSTGTKAYNVDMAGAMITALPTLAVYVLAGRFFVRGLMSGAVKG